MKLFRLVTQIFLLAGIVRFGFIVVPNAFDYFGRTYTEETYRAQREAYEVSQYRVKDNPHIIPDQMVVAYASGWLLRGGNPILVNSEYTPIGKYIFALSIFLFGNPGIPIILGWIASLILLWILTKKFVPDKTLAILPSAILINEKLFLDQIRVAPLLDIIQLPFLFLCFVIFLNEQKRDSYIWTVIVIGIIMGIKTPIAGILISLTFMIFLWVMKRYQSLVRFCLFLPIAGGILSASYIKTFMDGYSFLQYTGFLKWIILYQRSKIEYPFSAWRLIFFNQWQAWWGDRSILHAVDWQLTWPVGILGVAIVAVLTVRKILKVHDALILYMIWIFVYAAFLSIGVISSRFLLPFLPFCYSIGTYGLVTILRQPKKSK